MSKKGRSIAKQKKSNSPAKIAKAKKKNYYSSMEAKEKWEEKKRRRDERKYSKGEYV